MKKSNLSLLIAAMLLATGFSACREKKKTDVIIAPKQETPKPKKTQAMDGYEQTRDVQWLDSHYKVTMKRVSDSSLPLAVSEDGTKYYDNRITVTITRADGSQFFSRTFSKADFNAELDAETRENGALLGIVFVEAKGDNLVFAGSVGSPDITSDEYVPLLVKISRMGNVRIEHDTQLDTGSTDASESNNSEEEEGV